MFFPQILPDATLPHVHLIQVLLTEEFGSAILEQLISLLGSAVIKGRNKEACCEKHAVAVAKACEVWEVYVHSWPQVIPKETVYECLNAYYKGSQWVIPPVCCVCSRQQHAVEMHNIVLNANVDFPEYLSILCNNCGSCFVDNEFCFTDPRLNGLVFVEQRMVYSIYYMDTLVLPCVGERRRLLIGDGSGRRTRDVIHIRCIGICLYIKYIT